MKKIIIFSLILIMVLLSGCGSKSEFAHLPEEERVIYEELVFYHDIVFSSFSSIDKKLLEDKDTFNKYKEIQGKMINLNSQDILTKDQKTIWDKLMYAEFTADRENDREYTHAISAIIEAYNLIEKAKIK